MTKTGDKNNDFLLQSAGEEEIWFWFRKNPDLPLGPQGGEGVSGGGGSLPPAQNQSTLNTLGSWVRWPEPTHPREDWCHTKALITADTHRINQNILKIILNVEYLFPRES